MSTARKRLERLKRETRLNPMPIPSSLEAAFMEIEKPMVRYADAIPASVHRAKVARLGLYQFRSL
jgi:hypothetical protein